MHILGLYNFTFHTNIRTCFKNNLPSFNGNQHESILTYKKTTGHSQNAIRKCFELSIFVISNIGTIPTRVNNIEGVLRL